MAQISVTVADNKEQQIYDAFVATFANPDNLTPQQLTKLHIKNFLKGTLREYQRKAAIAQVDANLDAQGDL